MSQGYDQPTITPGEHETGLTTKESYGNIDPTSPNYQSAEAEAGGQKKSSIFGKLKDKTKKASSKIKSKVGKKKSDGTTTTVDEEDEEYGTSSSSSSAGDDHEPASEPAITPYTGPASVPREFGTYNQSGESERDTKPDSTSDYTEARKEAGLSAMYVDENEAPSSAKDALYGGAAATAGALGYDASASKDEPQGKSVAEKTSEASSDVGGKAQEVGNRGYDAATDAKDTVAEKGSEIAGRTKDTFSSDPSSGPGPVDRATDAAYGTKDAAQSKAADVNNATNDSETYTEKASNAAVAAKDTVAGTLGLDKPSSTEGPSMVDKAKGYLGSAVDTTKDYTGSATDATKQSAGSAADTTRDYGARARDTTADTVTPRADDKALSEKVTETLGALPAKVKDTATSYTQSANTPTTTTPTTTTAPHDAAAPAAADQPGILGKIGGLFGFGGQKAPEDHAHAASAPADPTTTTATY